MRVTWRVIGFLFAAVAGAGCSGSTPADPGHPGPAVRLLLTSQPSASATDGLQVLPGPTVALADANGTLVAQSGVSITASIESGGGDLSGTITETTAASGQATFSNLIITGLVGPRVLRFAAQLAGASVRVVSQAVAVIPGGVSRVAMVVQPSLSAVSGVPLARQPSVQVQDIGGNPVPIGSVVVSVKAGFEGCLLPVPLIVTNPSGVASFQGLTVASASSPFVRLIFSVPGFGVNAPEITVVSDTIALPVLARLAIVTQPSPVAHAGVPFPQQPVVRFSNEAGDLVHWPASVTAAVVSGPAPRAFGTGSQETAFADLNGMAMFTGLNLETLGPRTIQFSSDCFQPVTSATITVQP